MNEDVVNSTKHHLRNLVGIARESLHEDTLKLIKVSLSTFVFDTMKGEPRDFVIQEVNFNPEFGWRTKVKFIDEEQKELKITPDSLVLYARKYGCSLLSMVLPLRKEYYIFIILRDNSCKCTNIEEMVDEVCKEDL